MHDHIITGYDGSKVTAAAATWAADEAVRREVGLTVLGCYVEPTMTDFGLSSVFGSAVKTITLRDSTQAHVIELVAGSPQSHPGLSVNAFAVHGRPSGSWSSKPNSPICLSSDPRGSVAPRGR